MVTSFSTVETVRVAVVAVVAPVAVAVMITFSETILASSTPVTVIVWAVV